MRISVITPSFLGLYPRCAKDRESKLIRAIDSVCNQDHTDWELIVISDGCEKTAKILTDYLLECDPEHATKIRGIMIPKQKSYAGATRNTGINKAMGDIVCYLDSDDYLGKEHLQFIKQSFKPGVDWIWFDDLQVNGGLFKPFKCSVKHYGLCGTSNIAHRRALPCRWPISANYAHDDWGFIRALRTHAGAYAGQGYYHVCHVPGKYEV